MPLTLRDAIPRMMRWLNGQRTHSSEVGDVIEVAAALNMGEFDLFRMAYAQFYGGGAALVTVGTHFLRYLSRQVVPPFVRHFTHKVLDGRRRRPGRRSGYGIAQRHRAAALRGDEGPSRWLILAAGALGFGALALLKLRLR